MGSNSSVRQFRTDMKDLVNKAKYNFHQELLAMGDELVGNIQNAIQHSVTGHLRQSVRKRDFSSQDGTKLTVLVIAGGPLTTKREASGPHDYALDEEFGSVKETPRPFFYSTARLYTQQGLEQFRETLDETIAENNQIRAIRSNNYSNASVTSSHRGAATSVGKKRL